MATLTLPVDEKKKVGAGSPDYRRRGHCDCLQAGRRGRSHCLPDSALRHGDAVHQPAGRRRRNGLRIHRGGRRTFTIRNRKARLGLRSTRVLRFSSGVGWMYAMEALTVTPALRVPMVAWSATGRSMIPARSAWNTTTRWRSATSAGCLPGWIAPKKRWTPRLIAYRVAEDRRITRARGHQLRRRIPHPLAGPGQRSRRQEQVKKFLPRYDRGDLLLHPDNVISVAPQCNEDWVMEIRRQNYARHRAFLRRDQAKSTPSSSASLAASTAIRSSKST